MPVEINAPFLSTATMEEESKSKTFPYRSKNSFVGKPATLIPMYLPVSWLIIGTETEMPNVPEAPVNAEDTYG